MRGWGFAAGQDASPGQRGVMWPFADGGVGGSGVDGGGGGGGGVGGGGVPGEAYCKFTVWGGLRTPGGVSDNLRNSPPSSSPPSPSPSPSSWYSPDLAAHVAASNAGEAAGGAGAVGSSGSLRSLTTPAQILSSGLATCEMPALPSSAAPPGSRISAAVALVLNGGSHSLSANAALFLAAPDAPGPPLQLDGHSFRAAADAAADAADATGGGSVGPTAPLPPVAVIGNAAGGTAVVLTAPVARQGASRETSRFASEYPPQAGGSEQGTDGWATGGSFGGSGPWGSGGGDGLPDAACSFGTVRPVSARPTGARRVAGLQKQVESS
jgi:hypothetical protein